MTLGLILLTITGIGCTIVAMKFGDKITWMGFAAATILLLIGTIT